MAKKSKEDLEQDFFGELSKNIGGELLEDMSVCPGFIDTGILSVNYINSGKFVGGGIAQASIAECAGQSAAGKSLLSTNLLRGCQTCGGIAILLDAEHAINKEFCIRASHVDPKKLIVVASDSLQGSFNKIHKIIRYIREEKKVPLEKPIVICYDSLSASPSERELVSTRVDLEEISEAKLKEMGGGFSQKVGERASICSLELRKLMPTVKKHNVLVFFVNQLRTNIGVMYGDNLDSAAGGLAIKYVTSTRMRMYSSKQIKNSDGRTIGMNVLIKNTKSRFTYAHQSVNNVRLFFDNGVDPMGGLLDLCVQIGRVKAGTAGNYTVDEKYTDGKVVKFKSSKLSNTIPIDVLLDNPKLVDAETPEQIMYYINMFGEANKAANSDLLEEDIKSSDDMG